MREISNVRELIDLWPTRSELAVDISRRLGREVSAYSVHKWASSGAIPAKYQRSVVLAGGEKGYPIDAELMLRLHHRGTTEAAA